MKNIKYKKTFISGFIFKTFEVVLELLLPILMAVLMDKGLKDHDIKTGLFMVLLIILVAVLGYLTTLYAQYAAAKVGQGYAMELRRELFHHAIDLPLADTNEISSSSFINRMNMDVNNLQQSLSMTIRLASRAPVLMIGSIIALWFLSPKIALVLIIGLPLLILILSFVMYYSVLIFKKFQVKNDKIINIVKDNTEGIRMIKSFGRTNHEQERFSKHNNVLEKTLLKLGRITSIPAPFTMLYLNILLVIMIYFGAFNINNGSMSDSELLQIINYTQMLTLSIIGVMNLMLIYTKGFSSLKRVKEVLNINNSIIEDNESIKVSNKPLKIEFKDVSFNYNNGGLVLNNLNFKIEEGETVGIVGLTGSGKSSIAYLLQRFFDVSSGEILINDINIKKYDINSLRESIAYQEQKPILLYGNVRDNIKMGKNISDEEINFSIKQAEASFILSKKHGIDEEVLRSGSNFSGGQRQRIALSRALAKDAKLLILDDTFSALDYLTDLKIRENINKNTKNQTKIFISQRLSSVYHADKIIVINEGSVLAVGTHSELLESSELYLNIYNSQTYGGKVNV